MELSLMVIEGTKISILYENLGDIKPTTLGFIAYRRIHPPDEIGHETLPQSPFPRRESRTLRAACERESSMDAVGTAATSLIPAAHGRQPEDGSHRRLPSCHSSHAQGNHLPDSERKDCHASCQSTGILPTGSLPRQLSVGRGTQERDNRLAMVRAPTRPNSTVASAAPNGSGTKRKQRDDGVAAGASKETRVGDSSPHNMDRPTKKNKTEEREEARLRAEAFVKEQKRQKEVMKLQQQGKAISKKESPTTQTVPFAVTSATTAKEKSKTPATRAQKPKTEIPQPAVATKSLRSSTTRKSEVVSAVKTVPYVPPSKGTATAKSQNVHDSMKSTRAASTTRTPPRSKVTDAKKKPFQSPAPPKGSSEKKKQMQPFPTVPNEFMGWTVAASASTQQAKEHLLQQAYRDKSPPLPQSQRDQVSPMPQAYGHHAPHMPQASMFPFYGGMAPPMPQSYGHHVTHAPQPYSTMPPQMLQAYGGMATPMPYDDKASPVTATYDVSPQVRSGNLVSSKPGEVHPTNHARSETSRDHSTNQMPPKPCEVQDTKQLPAKPGAENPTEPHPNAAPEGTDDGYVTGDSQSDIEVRAGRLAGNKKRHVLVRWMNFFTRWIPRSNNIRKLIIVSVAGVLMSVILNSMSGGSFTENSAGKVPCFSSTVVQHEHEFVKRCQADAAKGLLVPCPPAGICHNGELVGCGFDVSHVAIFVPNADGTSCELTPAANATVKAIIRRIEELTVLHACRKPDFIPTMEISTSDNQSLILFDFFDLGRTVDLEQREDISKPVVWADTLAWLEYAYENQLIKQLSFERQTDGAVFIGLTSAMKAQLSLPFRCTVERFLMWSMNATRSMMLQWIIPGCWHFFWAIFETLWNLFNQEPLLTTLSTLFLGSSGHYIWERFRNGLGRKQIEAETNRAEALTHEKLRINTQQWHMVASIRDSVKSQLVADNQAAQRRFSNIVWPKVTRRIEKDDRIWKREIAKDGKVCAVWKWSEK